MVFRLPGEMSLSPEELVRSNRFESLGHLAGGSAHAFNNLLTTILGGVSLANRSVVDASAGLRMNSLLGGQRGTLNVEAAPEHEHGVQHEVRVFDEAFLVDVVVC